MIATDVKRLFLAAFLPILFCSAHAEAPAVKGNGPAYYRMMLGGYEVTALSDGTVQIPVNKILKNIQDAAVDRALAEQGLKSPLETSVNAFLINTRQKLVLIDAGAANLFGPTLGNLLANLNASGYAPEQVDEIYITHMHPDHVGGLVANGRRVFPNAVVRANKAEADYWLSTENLGKAPEADKAYFRGAQQSLEPYVTAGRFRPYQGNQFLSNGIRVIVTAGHTPGHSVFVVENQGQKMVVLGDLMHVAAVQFANPSVATEFDTDSPGATTQRAKFYDDAANVKHVLAIAHVSFPGLGRLRKDGAGYVWIPVNYSVVR